MRYPITVFLLILLFMFAGALPGRAQTLPAQGFGDALPRRAAVPLAKTAQDVETVRYYGEVAFVDDLQQDRPAFVVRLTAPVTGAVTGVSFPLYNGPLEEGGTAAGVAGTGTLRLQLFDGPVFGGPLEPPALDATPLAQLDVPFDELEASAMVPPAVLNEIDLTDAGFDITEGRDYYVRLLLADASADAALSLVTDAGSTDPEDENYYPARTALYQRGSLLGEGQEEGYFLYENHANLVIDLVVTEMTDTATDPRSGGIPHAFALAPNYPNPFNPRTTIAFDVPQAANVSLIVYNVLGAEVTRLVDRRLEPGSYTATWNATDLPSGIYLYRLRAGAFTQTRRMVLVK